MSDITALVIVAITFFFNGIMIGVYFSRRNIIQFFFDHNFFGDKLINDTEAPLLDVISLAIELDRSEIAHYLHDGITQPLAGLSMELSLISLQAEKHTASKLNAVKEGMQKIIKESRFTTDSVSNQFNSHDDILQMIDYYCSARNGYMNTVINQLITGTPIPITGRDKIIFFRIVKTIINFIQFSQLSKVINIQIISTKTTLTLSIYDDGGEAINSIITNGLNQENSRYNYFKVQIAVYIKQLATNFHVDHSYLDNKINLSLTVK